MCLNCSLLNPAICSTLVIIFTYAYNMVAQVLGKRLDEGGVKPQGGGVASDECCDIFF